MKVGGKAVAIVSGGMDSTVLAYDLAQCYELTLLSFNYGQRHAKELQYAARTASKLGVAHHVIDLTNVTHLLGGSSLTSGNIDVPDGHYAADNMRITVVPNRNAIMLSVATGVAVSIGANVVATAVHGGDHYIYPDCRPEFVKAMDAAMAVATLGFSAPTFRLFAPYVHWSKADIAAYGSSLGVDFADTWSCYKGGDVHCGSCGTCYERREAFNDAGVPDPTEYLATPDYSDPRKVLSRA